MATANDIQNETKQHLSDMAALEKHILDAVDKQLEVEEVKNDGDALTVLSKTKDMLTRHVAQLEAMAEAQDAETRTSMKALFTRFLGNVAGIYNSVRSDEASRALRDTYTALNLMSASLTAMKTFGLVVGKESISKLAYEQMRELLPLIMEFNTKLPYVVAREIAAKDGLPYDVAIPQRVEKATQRIWNHED